MLVGYQNSLPLLARMGEGEGEGHDIERQGVIVGPFPLDNLFIRRVRTARNL